MATATQAQLPATAPVTDLQPGQKVTATLLEDATVVKVRPAGLVSLRTRDGLLVHVWTHTWRVTPVEAEAVTP